MSNPLVFTDHSPRTGLPYLFDAQAQKEVTVNEALARIDAMLSPCVEGESSSATADPVEGECWIVGEDADGIWSGHDGELAIFTAGAWLFAAPQPGMRIFDRSTTAHRIWIDGWRTPTLPDEPAGGATIDVEARAALADLVANLRAMGMGT